MSKEKQIDEIAKLICTYPQCVHYNIIGECANSECQTVDIAERLYDAGYRKQSEWISVGDRLPEDVYGKDRKQITVLVCTKSGRVSTSSRVRMMQLNRAARKFEYTDVFEWSGQIAKKVTHWMPLPEAPKMKGGANGGGEQ